MLGSKTSKLEEIYAEVRKLAPPFVAYYNRADSYLQDSLFKEEIREEILEEVFFRLRKRDKKRKSPEGLPPPEELAAYLVEQVKAEDDIPSIREYFIWEVLASFIAFYFALDALFNIIRGQNGAHALGWEIIVLTGLAPLGLWMLVGVVNRTSFNQIRRRLIKWYIFGFVSVFTIMVFVWGYLPMVTDAPMITLTPLSELYWAVVFVLTVGLTDKIRERRAAATKSQNCL
ncbi:MAG: hypothetical protein ACM3O9_01265 [Methylocystaceae bacterium]